MLKPEPRSGELVQVTYALRFADGQTVTGTIQALSRYEDSVVVYAGVVERLPFRFETADSVLLHAYFQSLARKLKAQFHEEMIGDWPVATDDDLEATGDFREQEPDRV